MRFRMYEKTTSVQKLYKMLIYSAVFILLQYKC